MTNPTLTVRSSPRIIAPDWRDRLRHTPIWLWLLILVSLGLLALGGAMRFPAFGATVIVLIIVGGAVFAAKALNSRVVITPEYVESRDALRRSRRCERSSLARWVVVRAGASRHRRYLSKVLLVDREGRTQLSLAWDSYSDGQLDQIRNALGLPDERRP
jgi:hypothetical protein